MATRILNEIDRNEIEQKINEVAMAEITVDTVLSANSTNSLLKLYSHKETESAETIRHTI